VSGWTEAEKVASLHEALRSRFALELIKGAGLTFAEVGEFVGVSKVTAWRYLNGHIQRPRRAHALLLSRLLETLQAQR